MPSGDPPPGGGWVVSEKFKTWVDTYTTTAYGPWKFITMEPEEPLQHEATIQIVDGHPEIFLDYFRLKSIESFKVEKDGYLTIELIVKLVNPKEPEADDDPKEE